MYYILDVCVWTKIPDKDCIEVSDCAASTNIIITIIIMMVIDIKMMKVCWYADCVATARAASSSKASHRLPNVPQVLPAIISLVHDKVQFMKIMVANVPQVLVAILSLVHDKGALNEDDDGSRHLAQVLVSNCGIILIVHDKGAVREDDDGSRHLAQRTQRSSKIIG